MVRVGDRSQIILFSSKQNFLDPASAVFCAQKTCLRLSIPHAKQSSLLCSTTHNIVASLLMFLVVHFFTIRIVLKYGRTASSPFAKGAQAPFSGPKQNQHLAVRFCIVPRKGLEPSRLAAPAPKAGVSTNFTTWAMCAW